MSHELFGNGNARLVTVAAGTFVATSAVGGTHLGVAPLGEYEYHTILFSGTFANHGTINAYAVENTAGSSPRLIASLPVGSGNGQGAAIEIKSDFVAGTLTATGTNYPYLAAIGTVESGGTWRGALQIISTWPRSAGTTTPAIGLLAYGTALS
jgi:hypothetical protein